MDLFPKPPSILQSISEFDEWTKNVTSKYDFNAHLADYAKYVAQPIYNVKGFGAKGDGVTDDTQAIQNAAAQAASEGAILFFPPGIYKVTDTITINYGAYRCHWRGTVGSVRINFVNDVPGKTLLDLTGYSSYSTFEGLHFNDVNARTSTCIRIADASNGVLPGDVTPNWKNTFFMCKITNFKLGLHLATADDPLNPNTMNFASETLFLHCKFRNCELTVYCNNHQSVNNMFIQTDIENDAEGEQFTMIRYEAGGGLTLDGCSIIGKGRFFEWIVPQNTSGLYVQGIINVTNCRFEVRSPHVGELFYQIPGGNYTTTSSNVTIYVTNCTFNLFNQTIDLLKYTGRLKAHFLGLEMINGQFVIRNYPVQGASADSTNGSIGEVKVLGSNYVSYEMSTDNIYGSTNIRFPSRITIEQPYGSVNFSMKDDEYGFYEAEAQCQHQLSYGLSFVNPCRLVWNDPQATAGFKSIKAKLPKWARMTKFGIWKQPVRFVNAIEYRLYIVKDVSAWQTPGQFDPTTDAILVATIPSTENKAGLFEVPVQLEQNVLGHQMEAGFGTNWTERRIYIEHSGSTEYFGGFVYVEFM